MSRRYRHNLARTTALIALAMILIAAPAVVLLGEKDIAVSPALWTLAADLCRVITGLFGVLVIVSAVTGRGSESSRQGTFGAILGGVVFIAAAVAGLGLVIVVTGLGGLGLLYAGGAVAVDAFRSRNLLPAPPELARHV